MKDEHIWSKKPETILDWFCVVGACIAFYLILNNLGYFLGKIGFFIGILSPFAGGIVIADRYTTSNAVHQCSKLPPEQWDDFLRWAFDYEYRLLGLPAPDAVVYLQVAPAVSQKLMTGRYHGDESRKDVHEKDIEYLARSRRAAEYCAAHLGWATVHCTENGAMRTIEEIQAEVRALAEKELG